ncbi:MAG: YdjY domain-containing protein [Akkermansiaceae bacterium]|nr:YdjY domain-containing protein [Akkermansiaceae bacterium]
MSNSGKKNLLGLTFWAAAMMVALGEPAPSAPEDDKKPEFEVTPTEVKLPGVTVSRLTREVRIDAKVCLQKGILEYVVCRPNTFEHEAIFTTDAKPELVHAALLLCGLKPTPQLRGMGELWFEKAIKQKQSRVKIEVEWNQDGKKKRVNLTSMLLNRQDLTSPAGVDKTEQEPVVQDAWIFAGSFLQAHPKTKKKSYAANSSGILVGIWPDPSTVIQYGISSGDPYKGKHLGLEINQKQVPKVGTEVKLVFSIHELPIKKPAAKK